ncbi:ISA3, partial [Symbiodinium necroappetens]
MPACLRVSLCSAAATRVGVDVYHVALPCLYGSEEVYHLLALKEDAPQPIPEAIRDTPQRLLPTVSTPSVQRSASVPGEASRGPRHRRLSMFDSDIPALPLSSLPQLSDIVMLLDASSPQKDIKQLHMNYRRCKGGRSSADGMPSLRKLVRPTDWESVHTSVTAYAAKSGRPSVSEKTLGPVCIRRPDGPHKFMVAKQAKLYFSSNKDG